MLNCHSKTRSQCAPGIVRLTLYLKASVMSPVENKAGGGLKNFVVVLGEYYNAAVSSNADPEVIAALADVAKFIRQTRITNSRYEQQVLSNINTNSAELCVSLNLSHSRVRQIKSNISKRLYEMFGKDFFDIVDDPQEVRRRLSYARKGYLRTSELHFITKMFAHEDRADPSTDLLDMVNEVVFLRFYSTSTLSERLKSVDKSKVALLLDILHGKEGDKGTRELLTQALEEPYVN